MAVRPAAMHLNEKLEYVLSPETVEGRILRTREMCALDSTFLPLLRMAVVPAEGIYGVPSGVPETYKPQTDTPDGMAETAIRNEFRRVSNFRLGGTMQALKPWRRETQWLQLLEGLHFKEAEVLTAIKDQTLLTAYPLLRDVLPALGLPVPPEEAPTQEDTKSDTLPPLDEFLAAQDKPLTKVEKPTKEKKPRAPKKVKKTKEPTND